MATLEEFLQQGIAAARAGQIESARQFFARAIQIDPNNETAWLWMSGVTEEREQRIYCLRRVLAVNPNHEVARRGLSALGAGDEATPQEETAPPVQAAAPPSPPQAPRPAPGGVPILSDDQLSEALSKADPVIQEALSWAKMGTLDVEWTRELRPPGRALPQIGPAALTVVIGALAIFAVAAFGSAIYRLVLLSRAAAEATPAPTATITVTPSPAPTPRPTRTPTPTLAPGQPTFTPPPTMPIEAPRGNLLMGLTPTQPYIGTPHPSNQALDDAIELFYSGNYEQAIEGIRAARESGPDAADSYYYEGMALIYQGEPEEAEDVFETGLEGDPEFAPLHLGLARAYLAQEAVNQARAAAERAKELDPELIATYVTLAEIYRSEGDTASALAEIESALAMAPYNVEVLVAQGQTLLADGQPDRAAAVGNLAVYIDPTAEAANILLAEARVALGEYAQATVLLEDYISNVDPTSAAAWAALGRAYFGEGNTAAAVDAYGRALEFDPESIDALAALGELLLANGDFAGAYDLFDRVLSQRDDPEARYGRAASAFGMGDYEQALEDSAPIYAQRPEDPSVALLYARALLENEEYEEVLSIADAIIALSLSDAERGIAYEVRGRARYHQEDYTGALADIETAMAVAETGTRHYYHALIREANGDLRGAMLELEWVLFWGQIYDYPFADLAAEHYTDLTAEMEETPGATLTPSLPPRPTAQPTPPGGITATP